MNRLIPARCCLAVVMSSSMLLQCVTRSMASPSGHRNTAVVLGAATAGAAMNGQMQVAPVLGAGALLAYGRYRIALRQEQRRRARVARLQAWVKENHQWLKQNHRLPKDWRPGKSPEPARASGRKHSLLDRISH